MAFFVRFSTRGSSKTRQTFLEMPSKTFCKKVEDPPPLSNFPSFFYHVFGRFSAL
jgi:hypothetical protein